MVFSLARLSASSLKPHASFSDVFLSKILCAGFLLKKFSEFRLSSLNLNGDRNEYKQMRGMRMCNVLSLPFKCSGPSLPLTWSLELNIWTTFLISEKRNEKQFWTKKQREVTGSEDELQFILFAGHNCLRWWITVTVLVLQLHAVNFLAPRQPLQIRKSFFVWKQRNL